MRYLWCLVPLALAGPLRAEDAPPAAAVTPLDEKLDWMPKFQLRGRVQVDAVVAAQSQASQDEIGTIQNGYGLRRARLGAQGTIDHAARWVAEADFAGGKVSVRDMYVALTALPCVDEVRVGNFREPFSLDGATSSNDITFMERSPLNQLDPTRNWGVAGSWYAEADRATLAVGVFRNDSSNGQSLGNGGNWAATGRLTALPLYDDTEDAFRLIHVGGAISYRVPLNGVVTYSQEPQSPLLTVADNPSSSFLPTISVPASSQQLYNLQAALVLDSFSLQGEWIATTIQQTGGGVVFLHGFYVDASYFLTGEHRGYNFHTAAFDKVAVLNPLWRAGDKSVRGCGAVELAARFAYANFDSPNLPLVPTNPPDGPQAGTTLYQATFGVNWYLNDNTRVMLNYTLAIPAVNDAAALPVHLFGVRTAIFW
jgi:phosphate-selective porin OprO/OprP